MLDNWFSKKNASDVLEQNLLSDIREGYVCPSCRTRRHLIERADYRGVLLNAIDITVCIQVTKGTEVYKVAVESARAQLLKPMKIWPFINQNNLTEEKVYEKMLSKVETPYVAWLGEADEMRENHLFSLANELIKSGADFVYSCGCSGLCDDDKLCRGTYLARTRLVQEKLLDDLMGIRVPETTWIRMEPDNG